MQHDPTKCVSSEMICSATYAQQCGELRRRFVACLRPGSSKRLSRKRVTDWRGSIPNMGSTGERLPDVGGWVMPGQLVGDSIKGAGNQSFMGVLVERPSRLMSLAGMTNALAALAPVGFTANPNSIAAP
ncbi:hypothetical protein AB3X94_09015 [Paraburkholderia sp. BR10923]|uniref:hypothetical protein n=1 Tax=Paraburkholderia sp. BR10923 TaxID=3236992 RepID=UPI0034CF9D6F